MADECPHARLEHWYDMRKGEWEHEGICMKCRNVFGPFATWEQVRIAAGRTPKKYKKQAQAAKYRACVEALKIIAGQGTPSELRESGIRGKDDLNFECGYAELVIMARAALAGLEG